MTKYNNQPVQTDEHRFDSKAEYYRWLQLRQMEADGDISDLEVHPVYELQPAFKRDGKRYAAVRYEADFSYTQNETWVVEDVKGVRTAAFNIKHKLFLYQYPDADFRLVNV